MGKLSTKISGLALDTEYTFHLVLRTSAGQYSSDKLTTKTHKMTDLHGITITPGIIPSQIKESLADTVNQIGAKMIDSVRIDTTHFVTTEPRGQAWEKAVEMNVPVVVPDWVKGCQSEGKIIGVRAYYLDADPSKRQLGPSMTQSQRGSISAASGQQPMRNSPRIEHTPPTPERPTAADASRSREQVAPTSAPTEPPTVPPKPSVEESRPVGDGQSSMGGTTLNENQANGDDDEEDEGKKSDEEESKSANAEKPSESEVEGENTGKGKEKMPNDDPEDKNETKERDAAAVAEEDGKFDEVDL